MVGIVAAIIIIIIIIVCIKLMNVRCHISTQTKHIDTRSHRDTLTHTLTHANRLMHNHAQTPPARTHAHHLKCFEGLSSTVLYFYK